jgi:mRNA interferase MazF
MRRGDIVIVPFPFQDRPGEKLCPAVVVQSDAENQRLANTIVAMITGNLGDAAQPTTVMVDPSLPDGAGSGLHGPSLVKCYNLAAIRQRRILQVIRQLSRPLQEELDLALKSALGLT